MALIVAARLQPFRLPLRAPLETGAGRIVEREGVWVGLRDEDGLWGWGEAAPLATRIVSAEDAASCRETLAAWLPALKGQKLETLETERTTLAASPPAARENPIAASALECAVADLSARRQGRRLSDWLAGGRAPRTRIPVNALIAGGSADTVAVAAAEAREQGYTSYKLKVGAPGVDPGVDLGRVEALRRAVGDEARLRLDANGAWCPAAAKELLADLARFDIEYVEDPIEVRDLSAIEQLRELGAASPVPLAVDEPLADPDLVEELLRSPAASVLVVKPPAIGGFAATRQLVVRARRAGIGCVLSSSIDGPVGLAAGLHLAASLPGVLPACGLATADRLERPVRALPAPDRGRIALPEGPGLGVEPDRSAGFGPDLALGNGS